MTTLIYFTCSEGHRWEIFTRNGEPDYRLKVKNPEDLRLAKIVDAFGMSAEDESDAFAALDYGRMVA